MLQVYAKLRPRANRLLRTGNAEWMPQNSPTLWLVLKWSNFHRRTCHENDSLLRRFEHVGLRCLDRRPLSAGDSLAEGAPTRAGRTLRGDCRGLNGRTTVWPDPVEGEYKSGKSYLTACLESHHPIDLVVILLGTNDLKHRFGQSAWDIARSAAALVQIVMGSAFGPDGSGPEVLLIAPPPTVIGDGAFAPMFAGADEKSRDLGKRYGALAAEQGCAFLDAGKVIVSTKLDGIHLDASEQVKLGKAVAGEVRRILD